MECSGSINAKDLPKLVPSTRYQGSKRQILPWLYQNLKDLEFDTVLDGFGGTGSVSYMFKKMGKQVTYNDLLVSNYYTGLAFIKNDLIKLEKDDIEFITHENGYLYPTFIQDTFKDIYYLDSENKWLDIVNYNISMLAERYHKTELKTKQALAYHALLQACLCKRPFNLFHRKNLYLRLANVDRSFENKKMWDTDFALLFTRFVDEGSNKVFSNGKKNRATNKDIMKIKNKDFDLIYIDPPYIRNNDREPVDYYSHYHFFEGIVDYDNWGLRIDETRKNKCLIKEKNQWRDTNSLDGFRHLFEEFQDSKIAISYGSPGIPDIRDIIRLLKKYKSKVSVKKREYSYKLNHKNGEGMYEVLIIGNS
jgi:adenine-specific DNA methylase